MGESSLRTLALDLACLKGGGRRDSRAAAMASARALKFVAHHLWDPTQRENDPRLGCRRTLPLAYARCVYCAVMALTRRIR